MDVRSKEFLSKGLRMEDAVQGTTHSSVSAAPIALGSGHQTIFANLINVSYNTVVTGVTISFLSVELSSLSYFLLIFFFIFSFGGFSRSCQEHAPDGYPSQTFLS